MNHLPRAILFDLDDTLLSAYGRPAEAWAAVAREMAEVIAPLEPAAAAAAIAAYAQDFWSDPVRHREHRLDLARSRRRIVAGALAGLAEGGGASLPEAVAHRLADRFTSYRDEQMKLFPDAIETLESLRAQDVRLALVTNGSAEGQRGKIARFELERHFDHIQIEGEHGFGKPEEQAYRHALATLRSRRTKPGWSATIWSGKSSRRNGSASSASGTTRTATACPREAMSRPTGSSAA